MRSPSSTRANSAALPADDPHRGQPVLSAGHLLADARAAAVFIHGRGATAESILALAAELPQEGVAFLAPQAAGYEWYPQRFVAPLDANEPWLSSALAMLGSIVDDADADGPGASRTMLVGFSQGACLALEFAARHPRRYGGIVAFSGGLIGPPGTDFAYEGTFDGTPVFIGCGDRDPHIPVWRVKETDEILRAMGAAVTTEIYDGMGHTVNADELRAARSMAERLLLDLTEE